MLRLLGYGAILLAKNIGCVTDEACTWTLARGVHGYIGKGST